VQDGPPDGIPPRKANQEDDMTAHQIRTGAARRTPIILRDSRGRFAKHPTLSKKAKAASAKLAEVLR
jgi:hypothetical protein